MRTLPEKYETKITSEKLREAYEQCDKYDNQMFLSDLFGFHVRKVTQDERTAYLIVDDINKDKVEVVIASLPSFMGSCYMIIDYEDRIKAVEIGLNIIFA